MNSTEREISESEIQDSDINSSEVESEPKTALRLDEIKKFAKNFLWISVNLLSYAATGMVMTITGVSLNLLGEKLNVSDSLTLWLLNLRGFGLLAGSVLSGPILSMVTYEEGSKKQEAFYKISINKLLFLCSTVTAINLTLLPFVPYFWLACIMHFIIGFLTFMVEIAGTYLSDLLFDKGWQKHAVLNVLFVAYGLVCSAYPSFASLVFGWFGNTMQQFQVLYVTSGLITLLSGFFLPLVKSPMKKRSEKAQEEEEEKVKAITKVDVNAPEDVKSSDVKEKLTEEKKVDEEEPVKSVKEETKKKSVGLKIQSWINSIFSFKTFIILLAILSRASLVGRQGIVSGLMTRFASSTGFYNSDQSPLFTSLFYIMLTSSRLVFVFVSIKVNAVFQVSFLLVINFCVEIGWILLWRYQFTLWVIAPALGFICGPLSSANFLLFKILFDIEFTPALLSLMYVGQYIGYIGLPYIAGLVMDESVLGEIGFIISILANDAFGLFCVGLVLVLGIARKIRNKKKIKVIVSIEMEERVINKEEKVINKEEKIEENKELPDLEQEITAPPRILDPYMKRVNSFGTQCRES